MKKTLLALVLGSMAASSFAYVNLFASADGRSTIQLGLDLRLHYIYDGKDLDIRNGATQSQDWVNTLGFRPRVQLRARAWLNPRTNIGFDSRIGANWINSHAGMQNATASRTQYYGTINYGTYDTRAQAFPERYTLENGVTKQKTRSITNPRFERLYVYFENFDFGRITIAPGLSNIRSQEQGAADYNDFGTSTNVVTTPYSALSDVYLTYADWTARYDLTSDPNKKYRVAVSTSWKQGERYVDGRNKYARDIQASFGWKFDRNNSIYLNLATARSINESTTAFLGYTTAWGAEVYLDLRPIPGYRDLRVRTNVSVLKQHDYNRDQPSHKASFGLDVQHNNTFVKGLTVYGGYINKYTKSHYNRNTGNYSQVQESATYLGTEYWVFDSYAGDAFSLKYFVEGNYYKVRNTTAASTRVVNKLTDKQVATGFRLFY
ncbi:hypothetical protein CJP74_01185 [Psittacicella melopsittaci]|uniref:Porin n=1 Tax=Psittacicella melopsittaci TaxID=2028576 RepID=A0A3A1Y8T9_9GAMM|nr:hypothetical protein [Psittacicella melopsittaci]RIY33630.1 hypothetical protein CJP74_01185 [Psittacicella melopsittaci]